MSADVLRFQFGKNWQRYSTHIDEDRIEIAKRSLCGALRLETLRGLRFLDIGSGSGLFSLAARMLGATVHSFDYDADSVACTERLRKAYFPEDTHWTVERGSVLDTAYLSSLGQFDVVYSFGVLHHTGAMRQAFENVAPLVAPKGTLYVSIYNDQGMPSRIWTRIKRRYNRSSRLTRLVMLCAAGIYFETRTTVARLIKFRNPLPFHRWAERKKKRGMSVWHDVVDWVGGYPFEVAKPEDVIHFFRDEGFAVDRLTTCGASLGCNEFTFKHLSQVDVPVRNSA